MDQTSAASATHAFPTQALQRADPLAANLAVPHADRVHFTYQL
jgi:hypothetical protein